MFLLSPIERAPLPSESSKVELHDSEIELYQKCLDLCQNLRDSIDLLLQFEGKLSAVDSELRNIFGTMHFFHSSISLLHILPAPGKALYLSILHFAHYDYYINKEERLTSLESYRVKLENVKNEIVDEIRGIIESILLIVNTFPNDTQSIFCENGVLVGVSNGNYFIYDLKMHKAGEEVIDVVSPNVGNQLQMNETPEELALDDSQHFCLKWLRRLRRSR